ncbi:MAG: hypothetical protein ACO3H7_00370 [Candidatus Nanopelagicaceae bacterium]
MAGLITNTYAEKESARLFTAAARVGAAKIDYPAAGEVPLRNREHEQNFSKDFKKR